MIPDMTSGPNYPGVCGDTGVASQGFVPGTRIGAAGWIDLNGNLWLFGGFGYDCVGGFGSLNDLWEYNPKAGTWTWQSGSNAAGSPGSYGAFGVASVPRARFYAASWTDSSGNLWLFGGEGSHTSTVPVFSDLWKFNPTNKEWTWVNGSGVATGAAGVYGTLGVPAPDNTPGARSLALSWTDSSGDFWLFGGIGSYGTGNEKWAVFNDLWKFDPTTQTWTWVSGSNTANVAGTYGTKGVASTTNVPGSRAGASGWIDSKGNLWLYSGSSNYILGDLADLWEFNPATTEWTWVAGSNLSGPQPPVYGTQVTPSDQNTPGGRYRATSWIDRSDNLWLFSAGSVQDENDLWKFDQNANQWVWMGGSNKGGPYNIPASYGTMGVPSPTNVPLYRDSAVGWTDQNGNFWLFGGQAIGPFYNDLWRYQP
jgi:hypothetical protein